MDTKVIILRSVLKDPKNHGDESWTHQEFKLDQI